MDAVSSYIGDRYATDGLDGLPAESEPTIDLRHYWDLGLRHWKLILGVVIAALIAGVAATLAMTPIYRATTTIQAELEATKVLNITDVQPVEQAAESERFFQTQIDLLNSRSLKLAVAQALNLLADNNQFRQRMHARSAETGLTGDAARVARREQVLGILDAHLKVEAVRNSRIINVSFDSPDPALAADVSNAFAGQYIAGNLDRRFQSTAYARGFLERRLGQIKQKLEDSERQMIDYARSQQLVDASEGGSNSEGPGSTGASAAPKSLTTANLVQLNQAYSTARAQRIQNQERWRAAQSSALFSLPEVLQNETIQALIQRRAAVKADYENQSKIFKDDYPSQIQAAAQIREIDAQIASAAANIRSTIRTQFDVAQKQETALKSDVDRLKGQSLDEQGRSIRYNILRREADTNRQLYDALLQRYKEVSVAGGIQSNNISLVDSAEAPSGPIRPKPLLNVAIAGLLGLIAALGFIFVRDRFDDTVRTPGDLSTKLGLALVGVVPLNSEESSPLAQLSDARSDISESYSSIRASLQFSGPQGAPSPMLVTSSQQSEGKSTTSLAIALSFARIGRKVLLIDADMRRPSLHSFLGVSRQVGLSNLLTGDRKFDEVIQTTEYPGLSFIPCGPLPLDAGELLSSQAIVQVLAEAERQFNMIVLDGPPIMGLADAPLLAARMQGTLFVIETARTHRGQSKIALARLRAAHAAIIGGVLTKFDSQAGGYGRDYAYTYRYNYKQV